MKPENRLNERSAGSVPREKINKLIEAQAIKRMGEFHDVANVVDFFLRPESDFITGQVIYLGGVT